MTQTTVSIKGWVVIPKKYRQKYNFQPGSKVRFVDYGDGLSLIPVPEDPVKAMYGMLADGRWTTEDFLAEKRRELEREETKIERFIRSR